jgi:hypothetical protein
MNRAKLDYPEDYSTWMYVRKNLLVIQGWQNLGGVCLKQAKTYRGWSHQVNQKYMAVDFSLFWKLRSIEQTFENVPLPTPNHQSVTNQSPT